jgi:hypothetical protein
LRAAENSEVWCPRSLVEVAVAVIVWPTATALAGEKVKVALPEVSGRTVCWPMNFLPSFVPEGF